MTEQEKIDLAVQKFLNEEGTLSEIRLEVKLKSTKPITNRLEELGYYMYNGAKASSVKNLKLAVEEYISKYNDQPSITPRKSLTLNFPDESIFKSGDLIRHFIRGYWDGDGCLSYENSKHTVAYINVLGTEEFLNSLKNYLPLHYDYKLISKQGTSAKSLSIGGRNAFELTKYLYSNATIYLDRKYKKYLEYCRLYEESDRLQSGNIGETPSIEDNTEINSEIKESESSYSIGSETIYEESI